MVHHNRSDEKSVMTNERARVKWPKKKQKPGKQKETVSGLFNMNAEN